MKRVFKKDSLEVLRQRIDLVEVLSGHVDLRPSGSTYRGLCPFHDEKTPSFMLQRGDSHYHCFGCGAHGDAISFLMQHQQMGFSEAVESLANKFGVHLEYSEGGDFEQFEVKKQCSNALETASRFYHGCLLHTEEGHKALEYLYNRGIDLDFIRSFKIGLAPSAKEVFRAAMKEKGIAESTLLEAGLLKKTEKGAVRDFFYDRITFPIHYYTGAVIGFSARKYKEETFGGKYVNTPETVVFKKSRILFGLNYSRRRIAKERKAIIVEGQMDALRLIHNGFDLTVAAQGTAFGEHHARELIRLGVEQVFLALDADAAGVEASLKIGDIFQKEGIEAYIVQMPPNNDPDSFLLEHGPLLFQDLLNGGIDYLTFLVRRCSAKTDFSSPASKNALVQSLAAQIRNWNKEIVVHESLLKLARLLQIPYEMVSSEYSQAANYYVKRSETIGIGALDQAVVDPAKILEMDLLRWLFLANDPSDFAGIASNNLAPEEITDPVCRSIYQAYLKAERGSLLSFASQLSEKEQVFLYQLLEKKIDIERSKNHFIETVQKILERNWMEKREKIRMEIQSGDASEDEVLELCRKFDSLKNNRPKVEVQH